jgi:hypothetical protein
MKRVISAIFIIFSIFSSQNYAIADYRAVLSCGMGSGDHINILACFENTELEIRSDGRKQIFQIYNMLQAGNEYRDGLHINLSESFDFVAQNSHDILILELIIYDNRDDIVYQDQAGMYGVISVGN